MGRDLRDIISIKEKNEKRLLFKDPLWQLLADGLTSAGGLDIHQNWEDRLPCPFMMQSYDC